MLSLFSSGWTVEATCDLREVHGATAAVAILTRPTLGNPFHPPTHRLLRNRFPETRLYRQGRLAAFQHPLMLMFDERINLNRSTKRFRAEAGIVYHLIGGPGTFRRR